MTDVPLLAYATSDESKKMGWTTLLTSRGTHS